MEVIGSTLTFHMETRSRMEMSHSGHAITKTPAHLISKAGALGRQCTVAGDVFTILHCVGESFHIQAIMGTDLFCNENDKW